MRVVTTWNGSSICSLDHNEVLLICPLKHIYIQEVLPAPREQYDKQNITKIID